MWLRLGCLVQVFAISFEALLIWHGHGDTPLTSIAHDSPGGVDTTYAEIPHTYGNLVWILEFILSDRAVG